MSSLGAVLGGEFYRSFADSVQNDPEFGQTLGKNMYEGMADSMLQGEGSKDILDRACKTAFDLLEEHRDKVQLMTDMLMEFETLDQEDCKLIIKGEWNLEGKLARIKADEERKKKQKKAPPSVPEDARVEKTKDSDSVSSNINSSRGEPSTEAT